MGKPSCLTGNPGCDGEVPLPGRGHWRDLWKSKAPSFRQGAWFVVVAGDDWNPCYEGGDSQRLCWRRERREVEDRAF